MNCRTFAVQNIIIVKSYTTKYYTKMKRVYSKPEIKVNTFMVENDLLTGSNEVTTVDGNSGTGYGGGGDGTGPSTPRAGEGVWEDDAAVSTSVWEK